MTTQIINTIVSKKELQFKPGGQPATFEVQVVNASDRFASFQVELVAAGAHSNRSSDWYVISPTASSKKPPGAATEFKVAITDTPVPGFVGLMNITVRVFSMELPDEDREILRLILEQGTGSTPLKLDLPVREFQVYPGNQIQVPVRVYNPGQLLSNVTLNFREIDPGWFALSPERRLQVPPGKQAEATFTCQPPFGAKAPSQVYPFRIEATHTNGPPSEVEGSIEVLPQGFLDFNSSPTKHQIPSKKNRDFWRSHPVTYTLEFENSSNLNQEASIEIRGEDQKQCTLEVNPETTLVGPEQIGQLLLTASNRRPWLGGTQRLLLEVASVWSDRRVDTRNDLQNLQLLIKPIIPFWFQILGIILMLYLLWWLSWLNPNNAIFGHQEPVNSVQFNGVGERLVTASNDQKIIEWRVDGFFNPFVNQEIREFPDRGNKYWQWITRQISRIFNRQPQNEDKAVRVIRYRPVNNNRVATGLENGEINLWDLTQTRNEPIQTFYYDKADRVLALEFTQDSRYLFSGHGSGLVLLWNASQATPAENSANNLESNKLSLTKQFDFAIYALRLVGKDDRNLAIGGRYNDLIVWNWVEDKQLRLPYRRGGQAQYINSLDKAELNPHLLASADDQGYITLWNLRACLNNEGACEKLDEWDNGHNGQPVRSVALSADGCYLTSGGDDGRVMLWPLGANGRRADDRGEEIHSFKNKTINSVDIKVVEENLLIASGSDDNQEVRVKSIKRLRNLGCDTR